MKKKIPFGVFIILFFLVSCSSPQRTSTRLPTILDNSHKTPTCNVTESATATKMRNTMTPTFVKLTSTVTTTPTPTIAPLSAGLASGEHLVCRAKEAVESSKVAFLYVLDMTGELKKKVGPFDELPMGVLTPDGSYYLFLARYEIYAIDLKDWSQYQIPDQSGCTYFPQDIGNIEGNLLLFVCNEDNKLKVINIQDGNLVGILPDVNPTGSVMGEGKWSPDGKWIAYDAGELTQNYNWGPYIVPADCLQNTTECQQKVVTTSACIDVCRYWWTSDNLLAVDYTYDYPNKIGFFDPRTGALVRNEDLGGVDNQSRYSWSPEGRYLVIQNTRENGARMVKEIASGKVLFDLDAVGCDLFLGWLSIP